MYSLTSTAILLVALCSALPQSSPTAPAEEVKITDFHLVRGASSAHDIKSVDFAISSTPSSPEPYKLNCSATNPVLSTGPFVKCTGPDDTIPGGNVARFSFRLFGSDNNEYLLQLAHSLSETTTRYGEGEIETTCVVQHEEGGSECFNEETVLGLEEAS
ncbi:hypothetical protein EJ05DRAFT_509800 [Pseudovirgaria hyperparasitica]|uniref:AA1-like domain-containing protein n=1 Tax=Pseudovirgaria hyperparasitica TaxID=470096 RepID=A0A6A6W7S4_9PEZI|nr:uncharacterized protein EJ05DRAFT_509800 [Pseudovirgaria hyperparasitica]KAF2758912.1 hypothetical protein EJ05DRAFT_509800 [Pseudovirgaria hyperparasitica]